MPKIKITAMELHILMESFKMFLEESDRQYLDLVKKSNNGKNGHVWFSRRFYPYQVRDLCLKLGINEAKLTSLDHIEQSYTDEV